MIAVKLNQARFEYDIHSLVKAFYPTREVKVFAEDEKELKSSPDMPELRIEFGETQICCSLLAPLETEEARGEQTVPVRKEERPEKTCPPEFRASDEHPCLHPASAGREIKKALCQSLGWG